MTAQEFIATYLESLINVYKPVSVEQRFLDFKRSLSTLGIAKHLSNIAKSQPYISYIKYAKYEFDIEKLTAIRYKQVGDKFMVDYDHSVFYTNGKDFNYSALVLLLPYSIEEINGFIRKGLIQVGEQATSIKQKIKQGVLSNGN